jgi:hypothetical protein
MARRRAKGQMATSKRCNRMCDEIHWGTCQHELIAPTTAPHRTSPFLYRTFPCPSSSRKTKNYQTNPPLVSCQNLSINYLRRNRTKPPPKTNPTHRPGALAEVDHNGPRTFVTFVIFCSPFRVPRSDFRVFHQPTTHCLSTSKTQVPTYADRCA